MLIHTYSLVIVRATRFERQKEVYTARAQRVNPPLNFICDSLENRQLFPMAKGFSS